LKSTSARKSACVDRVEIAAKFPPQHGAEAAAQPAFAREAREGCRAEAQRAKAGYSARELRVGKQKY
jgi:hypothetical protein